MFDTIHHIAIIGSDYEKSKHFYVDLLGFKVIRENYRKERDDYKIDLACGQQEIELFIIKNAPARVNYPEALGLRHLAFKVESVAEKEKELKEFMSKPVKKESMAETRMASEPAVSNRMDLNPVTASQTAISRLTANTQEAEKKKTVKKAEPKKAVKNETSKPEMSVAGQGNVNEKIKELHKQGKSVLEISKQLNIGQGEVKLVLALYGGDNK